MHACVRVSERVCVRERERERERQRERETHRERGGEERERLNICKYINLVFLIQPIPIEVVYNFWILGGL